MFVMKDEQRHEDKVELRGGVGTLDFAHIVPPETLCKAGTQLCLATFEPGYSIGDHSHTENFEFYYVVEGKAKVTDDDEERILLPGDAEICSHGHRHSITNIGEGQLKILAGIFNNFEDK